MGLEAHRRITDFDLLFGPERCPKCREALTPKTLVLKGGRRAQIQCKCDQPRWFPHKDKED